MSEHDGAADIATEELLVEAAREIGDGRKLFAWATAKYGISEDGVRRLMGFATDARNARNQAYIKEDRRREGIGKIIYIAACIVGFVVLGLVINFVRDALRPPAISSTRAHVWTAILTKSVAATGINAGCNWVAVFVLLPLAPTLTH